MQEDNQIEEYIKEISLDGGEKTGWKEKISGFLDNKYFIPVVIILIAVIAFCLGRLSKIEERREPVRIISDSSGEVKGVYTEKIEGTNPPISADQSGQVVASKNGTKYHYPWCAGAKQISEKNKITFNSIEEARTAGYTPASNCKGLK